MHNSAAVNKILLVLHSLFYFGKAFIQYVYFLIMDISSFKNYLAEHNDNTDMQVSSMLVSSLFGSSMIISGDFSARRIFEFAGQQIGESYFRNPPSESKDQLVAEIADFFKKIGLGEVVHENMQPGGKQFV